MSSRCGAPAAALVRGVALVLLLGAAPAAAQAGVSGRVLDREQGAPIAQAIVRITSADSLHVRADTTDAEGRYFLPFPGGPAPYAVRAERMGYRALTAIVSQGEAATGTVVRDLRLGSGAVQLPPVRVATSGPARERMERRAPGGSDQVTHSWSGGTVPVAPGDLAGLAALQGGVQAGEGGVSFYGQDPSQTRTTLDGASFGATSLPQEALASVSITGSTYDVSRGEFSGGLIAARTLGGTNRFGAAIRTRGTPSLLQWRLRPGEVEPGSGVQVDGGAGGAIVFDRLFWYAAFSASRFGAEPRSLDGASPASLRRLGVDQDSAARFADLVRERGIDGGSRDAGSASESGVLRMDYDFAPGHSLMLRLDGRRLTIDGLGVDPLAVAGSGESLRERGGGVLAQLTSRGAWGENELRVHRTEEERATRPDLRGPAGRVLVPSTVDGIDGSTVLRFGGSPYERELDRARSEIADHLTFPVGEAHQLQAGFVLAEEHASTESAANRYGTFLFNSLADFRADRPSLFTRTLGMGERGARGRYGALYLGDSWEGKGLKITAGARVEGRTYGSGGEGAAWMDSAFGTRAGRVPSDWGISPRLGWAYQVSRWYLIGGIGHFRGTVPLSELASALGETGDAEQSLLSCVGNAAPTSSWERYAEDPDGAPTTCADGAPVFAARTSPVTLFARDFRAPGTWRGSIGGHFPLPRRLRIDFDASLIRGEGQSIATDANLAAAPLFRLVEEGGRPVYAPAAAIDPATGGVAADAARPHPALGSVRRIGGGGRSTVAQATVDIGYPFPISGPLFGSASYTFTRARDEVGGLPAFAASLPLAEEASRRATSDLERRHDLRLRLHYRIGWATIGVLGRLTSGAPFTPRVDGDVNGDGARNDPAFVFDPDAAEEAGLGAGMARLLADAPGSVRDCLRRQLGGVARRNSCRGPWTSSLDLRMDLPVGWGDIRRRPRLSISTSNALSLVDRVIHGREGIRGWGGPGYVDPVLLRVRGFDPAAGAFRYEVNPGFGGRTAALRGLSRPFALVVEARVPLGADPAYQPLERLIGQTTGPARSREQLRAEVAARIPNLAAQVISVDTIVGLALDEGQRAWLTQRARALGPRIEPLVDSLATAVSDVENGRRKSDRAAWREIDALTARIQRLVDEELRAIRPTLTPAQWEKLPAALREPPTEYIPPRGFAPPRRR